MPISTYVKMALAKGHKKHQDLASLYGWSKQSMSTKFSRDSWFGKDLVRVAEFTGGKLAFVYPDGQVIYIESESNEKAPDANASEAGE